MLRASTLVGMAHPVMYDDGDPHYQRIRALALALPEAQMKVSQGRPAFYTQKVFAYYGTSVKDTGQTLPPGGVRSEGWSGYLQYPQALVIRPDDSDLGFLKQNPRAFRPAYLGARGWFALDLSALDPEAGDESDDWAEAAEWLEASYRRTAPARCVRALDA